LQSWNYEVTKLQNPHRAESRAEEIWFWGGRENEGYYTRT